MADMQKTLSVQGLQYAVNELADQNVQDVQLADLIQLSELCLLADAGEVEEAEVWNFISNIVKQ